VFFDSPGGEADSKLRVLSPRRQVSFFARPNKRDAKKAARNLALRVPTQSKIIKREGELATLKQAFTFS